MSSSPEQHWTCPAVRQVLDLTPCEPSGCETAVARGWKAGPALPAVPTGRKEAYPASSFTHRLEGSLAAPIGQCLGSVATAKGKQVPVALRVTAGRQPGVWVGRTSEQARPTQVRTPEPSSGMWQGPAWDEGPEGRLGSVLRPLVKGRQPVHRWRFRTWVSVGPAL